jgi:hypothetical protein
MPRWRYRSGRLAARAATIQRSGSMSNLVVHDPVQSNDGFRLNEIVRLLLIFRRWLGRHRQRKDLGDLAQCNRHRSRISASHPRRLNAKPPNGFGRCHRQQAVSMNFSQAGQKNHALRKTAPSRIGTLVRTDLTCFRVT